MIIKRFRRNAHAHANRKRERVLHTRVYIILQVYDDVMCNTRIFLAYVHIFYVIPFLDDTMNFHGEILYVPRGILYNRTSVH